VRKGLGREKPEKLLKGHWKGIFCSGGKKGILTNSKGVVFKRSFVSACRPAYRTKMSHMGKTPGEELCLMRRKSAWFGAWCKIPVSGWGGEGSSEVLGRNFCKGNSEEKEDGTKENLRKKKDPQKRMKKKTHKKTRREKIQRGKKTDYQVKKRRNSIYDRKNVEKKDPMECAKYDKT